ncbi:MAG: isochorismate synthase [Ignavibacteriaceae bacterium]|jgi:menaquinone-specific isochorismate synthase
MKQLFAKLKSSYEIFLKTNWQGTTSVKRQNQLLSFCFALPDKFSLDDCSHLFAYFPETFYFSANNEEFLAVGNIHSLSASGSFRWKELEKQYADFPPPLLNSNKTDFINSPLFLATVKFDTEKKSAEWSNFKNCELYIPKFLIKFDAPTPLLRFNVFVDDTFSIDNSVLEFSSVLSTIFQHNITKHVEKTIEYDRKISSPDDKELWQRNVEKALSEIRKTSLTKIVLARRISMRMNKSVYLADLPGRLKKANPNSNIFYIKKNDTVFLGASPEILIEVKENNILTEAIAGSRKRGNTDEEDIFLENELRNSEKEINEHRSVVNFLVDNLNNLASSVKYKIVPDVKKLTSIQHLSTQITAKIKSDKSFFTIVDKLFPTPAVCGNPKEKAIALISGLEEFDRGLYAGLIGWISPSSAKLVVAIRSALIIKNTIFVYAGCGIVEGSDPESEFTETEIKFKTILSTLNEKN